MFATDAKFTASARFVSSCVMSGRMPEDEAEERPMLVRPPQELLDVYPYMEKESVYQYLSDAVASSLDLAALSERYSTHQYISGHVGVSCFDMVRDISQAGP